MLQSCNSPGHILRGSPGPSGRGRTSELVNLCGSEDRNQHSDLILRRSHALACDRLEGWPQAPSPFPSFETRRACGRDAPQRLSCETWFAFAGSPRRELARDHHSSGVGACSLRCMRLAGGVGRRSFMTRRISSSDWTTSAASKSLRICSVNCLGPWCGKRAHSHLRRRGEINALGLLQPCQLSTWRASKE